LLVGLKKTGKQHHVADTLKSDENVDQTVRRTEPLCRSQIMTTVSTSVGMQLRQEQQEFAMK
jgi:hypothetical protein